MFFNTHEFIFLFVPIVLGGFFLLMRHAGRRPTMWWLTLWSWLFYWSLDGANLLVLIASATANFALSQAVARCRTKSPRRAYALMWSGVALNALLFVHLKYAAPSPQAAIPLGLSFFTVQQVVYLISTYYGDGGPEPRFAQYLLFVSFFPYVVAGPMVRKGEVLHQYAETTTRRAADLFLPSLTLFSMGLFKKVFFADNVSPYVDRVFGAASSGLPLSAFDAWGGSLLYTLQIYFDFSGYSDMAAGLAGLFGIRLPPNFNSPYKARSIMEFWQRWHMSMTRFFTEFVYLPLAVTFTRVVVRRRIRGVSQVVLRLVVPMLATFFVAGLWHGAGSNFALFAVMMALALAINHAWRTLRLPALPGVIGGALTMAVVVTGMVLDRAVDLTAATAVLRSMVGQGATSDVMLDVPVVVAWVGLLGGIVLLLPNTHEIMSKSPVVLAGAWETPSAGPRRIGWTGGTLGVVFTAVALCVSVLSIAKVAQFVYYRF